MVFFLYVVNLKFQRLVHKDLSYNELAPSNRATSGNTGGSRGGIWAPNTASVGCAECPYYAHVSYDLPACADVIEQINM